MELNLSNNDVSTADEQINFSMPVFDRMHPTFSPIERAKVKHLGEVGYNLAKRKEVLAWIATHKQRFLELTAERFRLFWIPRMKRPIQTFLEAMLTILGLSGLVLLFRSGHSSVWIFAAILALYPLVYYLIQITPRFRLPMEPFLFLLAAYCLFKATIGLDRRRQRASLFDAEPNTASALR